MKRTSMILLAAGALAAGVAGTALADDSHGTTPTRSASSVATTTPTPVPAADVTAGPTATASTPVSPGRAGEIALLHVGGGKVIEVEPEVEHGRTAWSVKILKNGSRLRVYVDRGSGRIVRAEHESARDDRGRDGEGGAIDDDPTGTDDRRARDDFTGTDDRRARDDFTGTDDRRAGDDRSKADDHGGHDDGRHGGTDDMGGDNHGRSRH
ncbi:PepSY domain-containing protein [Streptomyces sp. NPDC051104]|uniref:PepSY domain-containing protein n=1 Tax=Streptomyces sp. NPDC051104 TaxID=3155044 RepID=UPI00344455E2